MGGAQCDIVRKQRRPHHVAHPVDRIGAPHNRHIHFAIAAVGRGIKKTIGQRHPVGRFCVAIIIGHRAAPVEHRAKVIVFDILRGNLLDFRLNHLPDFFLNAHLRQDLVYFCFKCSVSGKRRRQTGPGHG